MSHLQCHRNREGMTPHFVGKCHIRIFATLKKVFNNVPLPPPPPPPPTSIQFPSYGSDLQRETFSQRLVAQIEKQGNQNVLTVRGHMLHLTKGVRNTKNRHSGNMWSITNKHMHQLSAKTLSRSPKPQVRHFLSLPSSSLNL